MMPETAYGTAPGGNWKRLPFLSCDLSAEQPLLDADVIGLGGDRDAAAPFLDTVDGGGSGMGARRRHERERPGEGRLRRGDASPRC